MLLSEVIIVAVSNSLEDVGGRGKKLVSFKGALIYRNTSYLQKHSNDGGVHTGASVARD